MAKFQIKPDIVLLKPRITEKAALASSESNVYVFEVKPGATKSSVSASVRVVYGVTPKRVHLLAIPKKKVFIRGNKGVKGGGKKAYVYLKKGDKIETM